MRTRLIVNEREYEVDVEARDTLLQVIRNTIGLTGTKEGCGTGECGSCTVLLNGRPVNSCLVLAVDVEGQKVTTIEGQVDDSARLLQKAFVEHGAIQCGFCTPGMIVSAKALLDERSNPNEEEIRFALAGNICRCTGYIQIIEAIKAMVNGKLQGK